MKGLPGLRMVPTKIPGGISDVEIIRPGLSEVLDDIVAALTKPLTAEEKSPKPKVEKPPRIIFKGDWGEVNQFFYKRGWAPGFPIVPPTEEAIAEMLTGTDLPPDHVVAKIPPRFGKATVEKIAINAVMAGCLPIYMPVVIAGVQAMVDPDIALNGYTCSLASWAPFLTVNGPIRNDLNINRKWGLFTPYYKPNTAIGHAIGFITQNIAGVRPGVENMAVFGHEGGYGMCIAENEEESPWEPLHVERGFKKEDSAVTIFYPNGRSWLNSGALYGGSQDAAGILGRMIKHVTTFANDPGNALIMLPGTAKIFAEEGWTKKEIMSYIVEYARWPASDFRTWPPRRGGGARGEHIIGGDRGPKVLPVPQDPTLTRRIFHSSQHMMIIVAGGSLDQEYTLSLGGGGHYGGPVTQKIELPANWDKLVKKYKDLVPTYAPY